MRPQDLGLALLLEMMRDAVIVAAAETGRIVLWNPAAERIFGYTASEAIGLPVEALVPERFKAHHRAGFARYSQIGRGPLVDAGTPVEVSACTKTGEEIPAELTLSPLEGPSLDGRFVMAVIRDVTERKRAEASARLLAEAGKELASSLDYETTLQNVGRLVVPALADWCVVDVVEPDGALRRLAVTHSDPAQAELAGQVRRFSPNMHSRNPVVRVLRTGSPELVSEVSDAWLERYALDVDRLHLLRVIGLRSVMIVPLLARGRILGAISYAFTMSGRRYGPDDLALAEELARRAALAVDNARLYREQRETIASLHQLRGHLEVVERDRLLDDERRRIARELHDRVEQTFFGIGLAANAALDSAAEDSPEQLRAALASMRGLATEGAEQMREAIFALSHAEVCDRGFVQVLWRLVRDFQQRTGVEADLMLTGRERRVRREVAEALYAAAREALANVERHARASAVVVSLHFTARTATLTVQDDGVGASPLVVRNLADSATHFGLRSLQERVHRLRGTFAAGSGEEGGFIVRVRLRLDSGGAR